MDLLTPREEIYLGLDDFCRAQVRRLCHTLGVGKRRVQKVKLDPRRQTDLEVESRGNTFHYQGRARPNAE